MSKSKPVAVILTDTHYKKDNLMLVEDIFDQAINLSIELGCKKIIHAGDWFTNRIGQNLSTLLSMKNVISKAIEKDVFIYTIAGNHDKTDQDAAESYLDVFSDYENFVLFRDQTFLKDFSLGLNLAFLPYFTNTYKDRLKELNITLARQKSGKNILITHKAFNGVKNNDGSLVEDGVPISAAKLWGKVLVGHYHDASQVGENISYIGSAYQANFGENITDKGFTILYADGETKFVQSKFPKYKKVKVNAGDATEIENELEKHSNSGDFVRFVFTGKKTDLSKIILSKFTDVGIDCKFESDEDVQINEDFENANFSQFDSKAILKHFIQYCKINEIPSEKRAMGLKFLKNVED